MRKSSRKGMGCVHSLYWSIALDKKRLFPILLVLITFLSVYYMLDSRKNADSTYQTYLTAARTAAEDHILVDAEENYRKAMELKPSAELVLEVGEMYFSLEEYQEAAYWYDRQIRDTYPNEASAYAFGIRTAIAQERYEEAFRIYEEMQNRRLASEEADSAMQKIWYAFRLCENFQEAGAFSNFSGMAAVKSDDAWGYVGRDGGWKINNIYTAAGTMGETAPVIGGNGEPYFIDMEGNRKVNASKYEEGDPSFGKIREFIGEESGRVLASNGQEVAFFDTESGAKVFGNYLHATLISNGVCGATKDGDLWALVDAEGKEITPYQYQKILTDKKGNPCRNEAVLVEENNMFKLIGRDGKPVNDILYEDADAFNDDTLAAVLKNGRWIFVDDTGNETDLGNFQKARSFSDGLAAVEEGNLWGYIDMQGNVVIEPQFEEADPISRMGVGFVKTDNGVWKLLSLYCQNHEE